MLVQVKLRQKSPRSYLWCKAAREELQLLSCSVSVSSKLDVFFILIVFFCKKNEAVSDQMLPIWELQCVIKIRNLSLWETFHEGPTCALVATGICIIGLVPAIIHFTLTLVQKTEHRVHKGSLFLPDGDRWAAISGDVSLQDCTTVLLTLTNKSKSPGGSDALKTRS